MSDVKEEEDTIKLTSDIFTIFFTEDLNFIYNFTQCFAFFFKRVHAGSDTRLQRILGVQPFILQMVGVMVAFVMVPMMPARRLCFFGF